MTKKNIYIYISLEVHNVTYNKTFWKTMNLLLFEKGTNKSKIVLVCKDKVVADDKRLCKTFTNFSKKQLRL